MQLLITKPQFNYIDVNECEEHLSFRCNKNAYCNNTNGGYECSCFEGYNGDGVICTSKLVNLFCTHLVYHCLLFFQFVLVNEVKSLSLMPKSGENGIYQMK